MRKNLHQSGWVYALVDPVSLVSNDLTEIRYIGYSFNPERRLRSHLAQAKRGVKGHRCNWLRQLSKKELKPILWLLEEADYDDLPELEVAWIADLKQCYKLVNDTDGGDGVKGYSGPQNITPEGRERQRQAASKARRKELAEGKPLACNAKDARDRAAEALRGYKHSKKSKAAFSRGAKKRFQDQAERKKISDAMRGKTKSKEHKEKLAEAARRQQKRAVKKPCPTCGVMMIPSALGMHRKAKGH